MNGSYCEWNIYIDETLILCSEKDIFVIVCIVLHNWNMLKCTFDDLLWYKY